MHHISISPMFWCVVKKVSVAFVRPATMDVMADLGDLLESY